ncbi:MAG: hypothetical protein AB4352_23285 [Hormoscilla sp.]
MVASPDRRSGIELVATLAKTVCFARRPWDAPSATCPPRGDRINGLMSKVGNAIMGTITPDEEWPYLRR